MSARAGGSREVQDVYAFFMHIHALSCPLGALACPLMPFLAISCIFLGTRVVGPTLSGKPSWRVTLGQLLVPQIDKLQFLEVFFLVDG